MKNTLTTFLCWFGGVQKIKKAKDLLDLLENRMTKEEKSCWNNIKFIEDDRLIQIDLEWVEGGWSFEDCRKDSKDHLTEEDKQEFLIEVEILNKLNKRA